jgi:hypothetical protein
MEECAMPKKFVFASALLLGAAVFGSAADPALAAGAKSENAEKRAECAREAVLYIGELKSWWMRRCMAGNARPPGNPATHEPTVHPPGAAGMPRSPTPLGAGNPPGTATGGTAPSNAPIAPSAPTVGSSGTSISGSGATSTSGSSNNSIGGGR